MHINNKLSELMNSLYYKNHGGIEHLILVFDKPDEGTSELEAKFNYCKFRYLGDRSPTELYLKA